jgi:hypothetical protein
MRKMLIKCTQLHRGRPCTVMDDSFHLLLDLLITYLPNAEYPGRIPKKDGFHFGKA